MKHFSLILIAITLSFTAFSQNATKPSDLFDVNVIHELRLTFDQPNWTEVLDSMRMYGDGMVIGNATIDGVTYQNVGIGYRGSTSFQMGAKRNPFQIKLNYIDKNQNHQGIHSLKLSNALRDPSLVREVLGYEIARKYMPAPRADYIQLYINKEYRGLYINVESVDEDFLQRNFGSSTNSFFKCDPDIRSDVPAPKNCKNKAFSSLEYQEGANCYLTNYQIQSKDGWDDLIELTKILNQAPADVESVLNVDRTLWMLAFNNVCVNLSSYTGQYSHNFFLYKDNNGQFNPIIWDLNLCFGSYKNVFPGTSDLDLKGLQEIDPLLHADNDSKPLISKLLSVPEFRKLYLSHVRSILYDNFENDWYLNRAIALQKLIQPAFSNDPYRFYSGDELNKSLTNTIGEKTKIPGIEELMTKRTRFLKKLPDLSAVPPQIGEITVTAREKFSNQPVTDFKIQAKVDKFPKKVKIVYRASGDTTFQEVYMQDDGKANDGEPGDKIFGVVIDPKGKFDTLEYYIIAENASLMSFEPADYMYHTRKVTLAELNN